MPIYDINGNVISVDATRASVLAKKQTVNNPNLANPNNFTVGLLDANGTINTAQTGCLTTDFIPCSGGQYVCAGQINAFNHNPFLKVTSFKEVSRARVFYNANKTVISGVSDNFYSADNTMVGIQAPSGTAYVRVSFGGAYAPFSPPSNPSGCFVHIADAPITNPNKYYDNGIEVLEPSDSQTWEKWGQTWTLFGDSLTDSYGGHGWDMETSPVGGVGWQDTTERVPWTGYFWASDIARRHGYVVDNQAHSGSNIYNSRVYTDVSGVLVLDTWVAALRNGNFYEPELITIGFGANTVADEIGSASDAPSNTAHSLYAGTKYFIEALNDACPNARKVYILHPLQEDWRDTSGAARNALRNVFDLYNVEYVDMSQHSGITVDMLPDKLHVSSIEANRQYGRFLESYLFG